MKGIKRIIFAPASSVMSHVVRCLLVGKALKERGHTVIFAGLPQYLNDPLIVNPGEFVYYSLPDFTNEEAMEALRSIKRNYTKETILNHIQEELRMFEKLKPDLVVSDFRLTIYISARVAKIPVVSFLNARWLGSLFKGIYHAPDTHPIPLVMKKILGRRVADILWLKVLNLIQRYKLSPYYYASKVYSLQKKVYIPELIEGDLNLILDTELLGPTKNLPPQYLQIGPLIWSPLLPLPNWIYNLDPKKPIIYVTMGSSGYKKLFNLIFEIFGESPYQIIVSTGDQIDLQPEMIPEGFFVAKYLPGDRIMKLANLVICHGGSQTIYQAIQAGTPAIVVATHLDQEWGGEMLQENQAGIFLTIVQVLKQPELLLESVKKVFERLNFYQNNMKKLREDLLRYNPLKMAVEAIEKFLDGKVNCEQ